MPADVLRPHSAAKEILPSYLPTAFSIYAASLHFFQALHFAIFFFTSSVYFTCLLLFCAFVSILLSAA